MNRPRHPLTRSDGHIPPVVTGNRDRRCYYEPDRWFTRGEKWALAVCILSLVLLAAKGLAIVFGWE